MMRAHVLAALAAGAAAQSGPALILNTCLPNATQYQSFTRTANGTTLYLLPGGPGTQPMCVDIEDFSTAAGAVVWTWPCGDGSGTNDDHLPYLSRF